MSKLLWVHTSSSKTANKAGFQLLSDADAAAVVTANEGQDPHVGLLAMKPIGAPAVEAPIGNPDPAKATKAKTKTKKKIEDEPGADC